VFLFAAVAQNGEFQRQPVMKQFETFLQALFPEDSEGFLEIRALPGCIQQFFCLPKMEGVRSFLSPHSGMNIFFGVAARRSSESGSLANCSTLSALFVDVDFKSLSEEKASESLRELSFQASIIIRSGGGLHGYWLLREAIELKEEAHRVKNVLRRLAHRLGGDLGAAEPARILRLPGTFNHKYTPARPVSIEVLRPELRYNICDFEDFLPEEPPEKRTCIAAPLEGAKILEGARNNTLTSLAGTMWRKGMSQEAIFAAISKENEARCAPPLSENEIKRIADSISRYEPAPVAPAGENEIPISEMLRQCGIGNLKEGAPIEQLEAFLREVVRRNVGADRLRTRLLRKELIRCLEDLKIDGAAGLADAALSDRKKNDLQGQEFVFDDPEPWPEEVDLATLLEEIAALFRRYVVLPPSSLNALTLWVVHTYCHNTADVSPILVISSPEKRCGKTLLLEILGHLVRRPLHSANITAAAVFRTIEECSPTLLLDEVDTFIENNDELRGVLNAGYRKSNPYVTRTVGEAYEPRRFFVWGPKALTKIGKLHPTLEDRSIIVLMKRKKPGEKRERFRAKYVADACKLLRRKLERWAADNRSALETADPKLPEELDDRAQDNWRPLVAIADLAGYLWPEEARNTALLLSGQNSKDEDSRGIEILKDLHSLFSEKDTRSSEEIVSELNGMSERPWPECNHGKPINQRVLARLLRPYGIRPNQLWIDSRKTRGYARKDFIESWERYLPGYDAVGPVEPNEIKGLDLTSGPVGSDFLPDEKKQ
jgi:putative DNA primase/helicase